MRKAEVQQVFIYLMVIIVVGAVLLFGYKSILGIMDKACEADRATFAQGLRTDLDQNTVFGSQMAAKYPAPCGYTEICFVNTSAQISTIRADTSNSVIITEAEAQTGSSVFVVKGRNTAPLLAFPDLETRERSVLCVNATSGQFRFSMNGAGRGKVVVSRSS